MRSVPLEAFQTAPLFEEPLEEQPLEEGKFEYSCVMALLPKKVKDAVSHVQRQIDPEDVVKLPGKDTHVTVLYGLHSTDPRPVFNQIRRHMLNQPPVSASLEGISLFQNKDEDVLKIGVHSPGLHQLNSVAKREPYTSSYPDYKPHVTIAHLKPGTGQKYLGLRHPVEGEKFQIRNLVHSSPEEKFAWMPLVLPTVNEALEVQSVWGIRPNQVAELLTSIAVGTRPVGMGILRPIYPSSYPKKKGAKGQSR